jgi:hypothetical protein
VNSEPLTRETVRTGILRRKIGSIDPRWNRSFELVCTVGRSDRISREKSTESTIESDIGAPFSALVLSFRTSFPRSDVKRPSKPVSSPAVPIGVLCYRPPRRGNHKTPPSSSVGTRHIRIGNETTSKRAKRTRSIGTVNHPTDGIPVCENGQFAVQRLTFHTPGYQFLQFVGSGGIGYLELVCTVGRSASVGQTDF